MKKINYGFLRGELRYEGFLWEYSMFFTLGLYCTLRQEIIQV